LRGRAWFPKYQIKTLDGRFSLLDSFDRCNRVRRPTDIARFAGAWAHGACRRKKFQKDQIARGPDVEIATSSDLFAESPEWWAEVCRDVDTVIHAAWYVEPGRYLKSPINQECFAGTMRLADGAQQAKVRRLVGIGTCFEYDLDVGYLSVTTPLKPLTPYAQAKVDTFAALSKLLPERGIEFAWCRLFYLFGEGEDARRLVPLLTPN
jgi:nucleoside-diphosphate-sugar epimerase